MKDRRIGVLGATSLVGRYLLPRLVATGERVIAFTRQDLRVQDHKWSLQEVAWFNLEQQNWINATDRETGGDTNVFPPETVSDISNSRISHWVSLAPIWVVPSYFPMLESFGTKRIVALSSTSRYTKKDSADRSERELANLLSESERRLVAWAEARGVKWIILRPTLIYDLDSDRNITEIARFVRRFGFFPLFGAAQGLRQPVHADDVAFACVSALSRDSLANNDYVLSGGETLPYREMVGRVFGLLGRKQRYVRIPLWVFRLAIACLRRLPRFRHWSSSMAERMNRDLVFSHDEAQRDLDFEPRRFQLSRPGR